MQLYQSSLGLTVGMHLTTDHGGPYRVTGITAPYYFRLGGDALVIYHQPVVTVAIEYLDDSRSGGGGPTLSPIGRDPDGTYWTEQNDQIWPSAGESVQLDMFRLEPPDAEPYAFQAGVDYTVADAMLWHCGQCGRDFTTETPSRPTPPKCLYCKSFELALQVIMMRDVPRDQAKASSYQRQLGLTDDKLVKPLREVAV